MPREKNVVAFSIKSAVSAFNRINTYTNGLKGEAPHITALGFEFYEYKNDNVFTFNALNIINH